MLSISDPEKTDALERILGISLASPKLLGELGITPEDVRKMLGEKRYV